MTVDRHCRRPPGVRDERAVPWSGEPNHGGRVEPAAVAPDVSPAVCFKDAEADTVYTAEVTLRNADSRPHAVKIIAPKSKRFHLVGDDFISVRLSPGLTTTFEVAFATDEEKDFWDACVVQTEVGTAELPPRLARHPATSSSPGTSTSASSPSATPSPPRSSCETEARAPRRSTSSGTAGTANR